MQKPVKPAKMLPFITLTIFGGLAKFMQMRALAGFSGNSSMQRGRAVLAQFWAKYLAADMFQATAAATSRAVSGWRAGGLDNPRPQRDGLLRLAQTDDPFKFPPVLGRYLKGYAA
ncbi:MAG: hypothetical protein ACREC0_07280 [Methylocella sp.]